MQIYQYIYTVGTECMETELTELFPSKGSLTMSPISAIRLFPQKETLGVAHIAPDRHLRVADPVHEEISLLSVYKVVMYLCHK